MKICNKCHRELELTDFFKADTKDGVTTHCKDCIRSRRKIYNQRIGNKRANERYHSDPVYRQEHLERCKKLQLTKKEQIKLYLKQYYISHKIEHNKHTREYRNKHRKEINKWLNEYYKDPARRIALNMRNRVRIAIANQLAEKSQKTVNLCGCSWKDLVLHIESQFKPGMTWDNYGRGENKWSIDHIIPCDKFDLLTPEEQTKCFHYTNLQPLWTSENSAKRNN